VAVRKCRLDGEYHWSLFIKADPTAGDDVEGLIYAVSHDRKLAAVIGLAPKGRVCEVAELLRDTTTGGLDLREVARAGPVPSLSRRPLRSRFALAGTPHS
jgi:hypothetical protein